MGKLNFIKITVLFLFITACTTHPPQERKIEGLVECNICKQYDPFNNICLKKKLSSNCKKEEEDLAERLDSINRILESRTFKQI
jgi:hypothetical protein